jgi:endonuclease G, mitochondrial
MKQFLFILVVLFFVVFFAVIMVECSTQKEVLPKTTSSTQSKYLPKKNESEEVVYHTGFTLSYNEEHEQANWVAYELSYDKIGGSEKRTNKFLPDPNVSTQTANDKDYYKSGYDRGHLAPAGDMTWSEEAMRSSFYYSNMSPQVPSFNRGIWKKLEEQIRTWALRDSLLFVATGPVLENGLPYIGDNKVSVPKYYYKVIIDYYGNEKKGIGFIMANEASSKPLSNFIVSIDSVEKLTGINFFYAIPHTLQDSLEKQQCVECWFK